MDLDNLLLCPFIPECSACSKRIKVLPADYEIIIEKLKGAGSRFSAPIAWPVRFAPVQCKSFYAQDGVKDALAGMVNLPAFPMPVAAA